MKIKTLILTLALMLACSVNCFAHKAKVISPTFNARTNKLEIQILHTTSAPNIHYIYKIKIDVNGKKVNEETLGGQKDVANISYSTYLKNTRPGDLIKITTLCNRGGTKTATIVASGKKITAVPRTIQKKKSLSRSTIPEKKTSSYKRTQEKVPEVAPEKPAKKKSKWF